MMKKAKPKDSSKKAHLHIAHQHIRVLEQYIKTQTRRINHLKENLLLVEKSRNALAQAVDPVALTRLHLMCERNAKLETAVILTRQALRAVPPDTLLTELENDIDRLLGGKK